MFFVLVVSLFTTRIVLQALGVIDYGIYNVVAGFVSMFAFLNTSMSNGIQRFYNFQMGCNDKGNITKVYNTALQIQALIALILLILLETFGLWYINYQMIIPADRLNAAQWIFQFSVLSLIIIVIQVPYSAAIMAHEKMQFYSYISIVEVIAKLAIAYLLLIVKYDKLVIYGLLSLIVTIIIFTANFAYAKIKFRDLKFRLFWDKDYLKPMLSFSGWKNLRSRLAIQKLPAPMAATSSPMPARNVHPITAPSRAMPTPTEPVRMALFSWAWSQACARGLRIAWRATGRRRARTMSTTAATTTSRGRTMKPKKLVPNRPGMSSGVGTLKSKPT